MKMYRCRAPNCGALLNESGYCARHQGMKPKPFANATRLNEALYKSARWKELRKRAIEMHPYCQICGCREELQVHHIIPPRGNSELFFDERNLSVVCEACHRQITAEEIMERGNAHKS